MADQAPFTMPEDITSLDLEGLRALREAAHAEAVAIDQSGEDISSEQLARLEQLLDNVAAIGERITAVEAEQAEQVTRAASARERLAALGEDAAPADAVEEPPAADIADADDEPAVESVEEEVLEPVTASAGVRRPTAAKAAAAGPTVIIKKAEVEKGSTVAITAAANVPEFTAGQELADMGEVAHAFLSRSGSFGQNDPKMKTQSLALSPNHTRQGVARIKRATREFEVNSEMSLEQQFSNIMEAAKNYRISGQQALTAAAGWCAPSETLYEFCELETTEGLLDIPEVTARRGGISFTKGPDFMTLMSDSDFGFIQTEAVVEAGETPKPCYAIECPPFSEVRLDAIGFCITAGLLTNAGYPELVRRILNLAGVGHARRKSQSTINRISTAIGTAINWTEVGGANGSGTADFLGAAELQALRIRQSLAMAPDAPIEGIAPYWGRAAVRHELSRRLGLTDPFRITDADVDNYLAVRNIRIQWVYDYQMLTTTSTSTWTAFPSSIEFMLYPAGAFVRLVNDVISLDAVYDHDLLTGNQYTAAFMEEGIAVANTCGFGVKTTVALNYNGSAGFPAIGAGDGVTFDAA